MRKRILVYYVNVGDMEVNEVESYVEKFKEKVGLQTDIKKSCGIVQETFIPVRNSESRVEAIILD